MDELEDLRRQIDDVDAQLLRLLNDRAALVHGIGEVKRRDGLPIYSPEREEKVLRSLCERNAALAGPVSDTAVRAIYREVMSASLALEKDLVIAYLGPEATWTHQAARTKFGASVRYAPQAGIGDVFDAVARGRSDYGVVPVENSTEGAVNHTLDVFVESNLRICAQLALPIENHFLARVPREAVRRIYSHPQVFGQCREWIRVNFPHAELHEVSSTARAGELAAKGDDAAALAGPLVGEVHGLATLERSVQDSAHNTTRFLVIGPRDCPPTGNDRTTLLFGVRDESGTLLEALETFRDAGLNLTKIESRPSKRRRWEYVFFVDLDGHREDAPLKAAIERLTSAAPLVKVLGSYPNTVV